MKPRSTSAGSSLRGWLKKEGERAAGELHPEEWNAPVSKDYLLHRFGKVIPGRDYMTPRELHSAENHLYRSYLKDAERLLGEKREMAPDHAAPDVIVQDHGSIILLSPKSAAADNWINDNLATEGWQWLGQAAHVAVEPRCVPNIVAGMEEDGLIVALEGE